MKILVHRKSEKTVRIISTDGKKILLNDSCTTALWKLAELFPNEWICWCDEKFLNQFNFDACTEVFHHDLIMASFAVETTYLPRQLGYIDQLPFVKVNHTIEYPTWCMSSDMGGIKGAKLLNFKKLLERKKDLGDLLNSVAKIGQQNSLFCYSSPKLFKGFKSTSEGEEAKWSTPVPTASKSALFSFVYQHYNTLWTPVLLLLFLIYEKSFPFIPFIKGFLKKKNSKEKIDLSEKEIVSSKEIGYSQTIDVIIPTMGRPAYLYDVLMDFSSQNLLPKKVIIIEQSAVSNSISELSYLKEKSWPFPIEHHFIKQIGVCNARNIALEKVTAEWVFFADDDIRLDPDLLETVMNEQKRIGFSAVNMDCRQKGEQIFFKKIKQWGAFGSGTSIVKASFAKSCKFSSVYELGYGEDVDFGMQLRNIGCDIIFHPDLKILHLKAPQGGFRSSPKRKWENEPPLPKPSPTLMVFVQKYYSLEQLRGFKTSLYLRYYKKQSIRNPISYVNEMNRRWLKSEEWSHKLLQQQRRLTRP